MILARHGESEYSVRDALNGDPSISFGLTALGQEQARALGEDLAATPIDLCVTSSFERVRQTADLALAGRDVPRLVLPELGDPNYGRFEGKSVTEYHTWSGTASSSETPGNGESRVAIVSRYVRTFGSLLRRPEASQLVVAHSGPLAYVLGAVAGRAPERRLPVIEYARPHRLTALQLEQAVSFLDAWCASPTW